MDSYDSFSLKSKSTLNAKSLNNGNELLIKSPETKVVCEEYSKLNISTNLYVVSIIQYSVTLYFCANSFFQP